jgi:hypothetical protein
MMRAAAVVLLCVAAAALAGCRSSAPLAPKSQVQTTLSNLGIYCGQATQLEAFPGHSAGVTQLDQQATRSARDLIRIMRADPEATYLGQNMRRVVGTAAKEMDSCYLSKASSLLWRSLG